MLQKRAGVACIALWGGRAPSAKSLLHLPALQTWPDGTRWDPDLSDLSDPRCWFGVSWIQTVRISFISNGFPWLHDWFMDIYGMIYLDPCGPRQRPHFNRAWQRFARKAIHVSRPGDVMRWSAAGHSLTLLGKEAYNIMQYYLNIIWILCSNNVVYWRVPQQISWANMSESWCSWTGLHEKE